MKFVFTNGCFDVLHVGHIDLLRKARRLGDWLIVGLNTDDSIKKLKGDSRPINKYCHREDLLRELRCVDQIVPIVGTDIRELLCEIRPDVWVKGGDYTVETLNHDEVRVADVLKIRIEIIHKTHQISTTEILNAHKRT